MSRADLNGRRLAVALLIVLGLGLTLVFSQVLKLRFNSGEIYPHYSSLRSDPLGTRALYDALDTMPGIRVSRNLRPISRIAGIDADTAVLLLGVPRASLTWLFERDVERLLDAVRDGARLVLAVNPGLVPRTGEQAEEVWWQRQRRIREAQRLNQSTDPVPEEMTLLGSLGVELVVPETFERPDGGWELQPGLAGQPAPVSTPVAFPDWYSQCRLTGLDPAWTVVAQLTDDGEAVVAERRLGEGSIVLASGAYFASNEALWESAPSEFLWWLIGNRRQVVFDESIHGARQSTGVMQWIRRYRLQGVFLGLLLTVALLAWRSGSSLLPKQAGLDGGVGSTSAITGETASSGMVKLLRRSVPARFLLRRCVDLWRGAGEAAAAGPPPAVGVERARQNEIDKVLEEAPNAVDGYRAIAELLDRRRGGQR